MTKCHGWQKLTVPRGQCVPALYRLGLLRNHRRDKLMFHRLLKFKDRKLSNVEPRSLRWALFTRLRLPLTTPEPSKPSSPAQEVPCQNPPAAELVASSRLRTSAQRPPKRSSRTFVAEPFLGIRHSKNLPAESKVAKGFSSLVKGLASVTIAARLCAPGHLLRHRSGRRALTSSHCQSGA